MSSTKGDTTVKNQEKVPQQNRSQSISSDRSSVSRYSATTIKKLLEDVLQKRSRKHSRISSRHSCSHSHSRSRSRSISRSCSATHRKKCSATPEKIGRLPPYCMRSSELKWKNDLDHRQFEFNEQILDSLHSTLKSLEQGAMSQAVTLVESSIKDLLQRQKLVRFADRNIGGWATAYDNDKDDLADNSADKHCMRSAESRVQKPKKNTGSTKPSSFFGFAGQSSRPPLGGWRGSNFPGGQYHRNYCANRPSTSSNNGARGCQKCGALDHWVARCPLQFGSFTSSK
uniref:Uncharacterized protein n=1 Tax=Romanomermis culicivorax TaxID=13658 RepID=A0A915JTH7_ROMCU